MLHKAELYAQGRILKTAGGKQLGTFPFNGQPAFAGDRGAVIDGTVLEGINWDGTVSWSYAGDLGIDAPPLNYRPIPPSPLIVGDIVYAESVDGNVDAVSLATGRLLARINQGPLVQQSGVAPQTGLGAGDGLIVVPAGTYLVTCR